MEGPRAAERGYLLLADLSGYTAYLASSDPEHGPLIAGDFIETIVAKLRGSFRLEKLEGDAAFLWAPVEAVSGSLLLDTIDAAYFGFQRRVQSVAQATTCSCEACRRIPALDLKFVCHLGDVLRQRIAGRSELAGRDVIVAHRLLKGTSVARTGVSSYLLLTDAAVVGLDLDPGALGMMAVSERYDQLGTVRCHLLDLGRRWDGEQSREDQPRPRGRPLVRTERLLPIALPMAWELLTDPARRTSWEGMESVEETSPGQRGVGAMSSCVVGRLKTVEEILDWRPFDALARRVRHPALGSLTSLYRLTELGTGTHLEVSIFGTTGSSGSDAQAEFRAGQELALDRLVAAGRDLPAGSVPASS